LLDESKIDFSKQSKVSLGTTEIRFCLKQAKEDFAWSMQDMIFLGLSKLRFRWNKQFRILLKASKARFCLELAKNNFCWKRVKLNFTKTEQNWISLGKSEIDFLQELIKWKFVGSE
jgi:hypothetical protein